MDPLWNRQSPAAYLPLNESCNQEMVLVVRTAGNAKEVAPFISKIISSLEPELPLTGIHVLSEQIEASRQKERYGLTLLIILGLLALGLASMGLFAVVNYSISRRTQEISIRIALGAERATVLFEQIREGLQLTAIGIGIGIFGGWVIARLMESNGIPIKSSDPLMYFAACLLLIPVTISACYWPARKALRMNPMSALKYE
jgi:ABC-type antimicrobial peptide transport system permease subunit